MNDKEKLEMLKNHIESHLKHLNAYPTSSHPNWVIKQCLDDYMAIINDAKTTDSLLDLFNAFIQENNKQQTIISDELEKIKIRLNNLENNTQEENTDKMYSAWCKDILDYVEQIAKKHFPDTDVWCDTGSRYNVVMAMLQQIDKTLEDI